MTLTSIAPKAAWRMIFSYLTTEDLSNLGLTNRSFNQQIKDNEDLIVKNFYLRLAKDQDYFICSIYQNAYYLKNLKAEITRRVDKEGGKLYEDFCDAKNQLGGFMGNFAGTDSAKVILKTINDILLKPVLTPVPLRRDTEACETFSLFQSHLNDVLFNLDNESQTVESLFCNVEPMHLTTEQTEALKGVNEEDRMLILAARWYKNLQVTSEDSQITSTSPLVESYLRIQNVLSSYCKLTSNYLKNIKNPFVFIAEYNTKWQNYVLAMKDLGGYLREYTTIMNEVYGREFSAYPNYPRFSFWRLMTKLWYEEVFSTLKEKMLSSFNLVLENYLDQSCLPLTTININAQEYNQGVIPEDISAESSFDVPTAINEFWNSILDMSLNEKTVSQLTCTDLNELEPVSEFCSSIKETLQKRFNLLLASVSLKSRDKFMMAYDTIEVMENLIPKSVYPDIQEVIVSTLSQILGKSLAGAEDIKLEEIENFLAGESNVKVLKVATSETIECSYPAFMKHVQLCRTQRHRALELRQNRGKKVLRNNYYGFDSCAIQQKLLEFNKSVDVEVLEQFKTIQGC